MPHQRSFLAIRKPQLEEYVIYHDETKDKPFAHAVFLVPKSAKDRLLKELYSARKRYRCDSKLHFADFSGSRFTRKEKCAAEWIELGVEVLRHKGQEPRFRLPFKCKLGILFTNPADMKRSMYGGTPKERYLRKIETLLRITIKGCLHYCFSKDNPVFISEFFTDGKPWHRELDSERILSRLGGEAKDYVSFSPRVSIQSLPSDHRREDCRLPNDAQLLQLCDLLLGSVLHLCGRSPERGKVKEILSRPVREMLEKTKRGRDFQHSGHYKSFTVGQVNFSEEGLSFGHMRIAGIAEKFLQQAFGL